MKKFILGLILAISLPVIAASIWPSGPYLQTFQNGLLFGNFSILSAVDPDELEHTDSNSLTNMVGKQFRRGRNLHKAGDADFGVLADWNTGNNAAFDGGGSLAGTFTASGAAVGEEIDGPRVYKYVQAAGSLDDFVSSVAIKIPTGYLGRTLGYIFDYKYNGNDRDIEWEVKCDTDGSLLVSNGEQLLPKVDGVNTEAKGYEVVFTPPPGCTDVKIGPSVAVENIGAVLLWSEGVLTPDPLQFSERIETQTLFAHTSNGTGSTNTAIRRWTTIVSESGGKFFNFVQSATDGDSVVILKDGTYSFSLSDNFSAASAVGLSLNSTQLSTSIASINTADRLAWTFTDSGNSSYNAAWEGELSAGDVVRVHTALGADGIAARSTLTVHAIVNKDDIISQSDIVSSDNIAFQFKATAITADDSIGTYNTYSYPTSSNAPSICGSAPTTAPSNIDGLLIDGRPINTSSNCTTAIARYDIKVGSGLKGEEIFLYKSTNRTDVLDHTYSTAGSAIYGVPYYYSEKSGILTIDVGHSVGSTSSWSFFDKVNNTVQTIGYIHFSLSKNPVVNAIDTIPVVDFSFENVFSMRGDGSNGNVTAENKDWINGNCTRVGVGQYQCPINAGHFTQSPSCSADVTTSNGRSATHIVTSLTRIDVNVFDLTGAFNDQNFSLVCQRQGSDYRQLGSTAAVIAQPTCIISETKAAGSSAGNPIVGMQTRILNTLEGDCDGISLNSNQITIPSGTWKLNIQAPAYRPEYTQAQWYNITDATIAKSGVGTYSSQGSANQIMADLDWQFTTTTTKTYEVRQFFSFSGNAGLGNDAANIGGNTSTVNTFTTVKLTRIR